VYFDTSPSQQKVENFNIKLSFRKNLHSIQIKYRIIITITITTTTKDKAVHHHHQQQKQQKIRQSKL
jgi:hypothetical protein